MAKNKKSKPSHGGVREGAGRPDSERQRFVTALNPQLIEAIREAAKQTKRPHTQFLNEYLCEYMPERMEQFVDKLLDEMKDEEECTR